VETVEWETTAAVLALLAPLVGVPLTFITFYLKGLREHQVSRFGELTQRAETLESALQRVGEELKALQRDYATKEEWLRESMWARGQIEKLTASIARAETGMDRIDALFSSAEPAGGVAALLRERLGCGVAPTEAANKEPR
jgi:hypothetical protein